jgi:hypothetical protein
MRGIVPVFLSLVFSGAMLPGPAQAVGTGRAFVSTTGVDSNTSVNCSLTAPCRSFAAAMTVINSGGEIVVLTSGGYGPAPVTIAQSVTIEAPSGVYAGITVGSGADGIVINSSTAVVALSGLTLVGASGANNGVNVQSASGVVIDHCNIDNFVTGINVVNGALGIQYSNIVDTSGNGITIQPTTFTGGTTTSNVAIDSSTISRSGANGIYAGDGVNLMVRNSAILSATTNSIEVNVASSGLSLLTLEGNFLTSAVTGAQVLVQTTGTKLAVADLKNNTVEFGALSLHATGALTAVHLYNNKLAFATNGISIGSSATVYTYQNNQIETTGSPVSGGSLTLESAF